ncbi:FAD-binding oxidoreductase [Bradyrhizobium sp. CCGUVB1N3]|uniref:NAD(P)/FAD-dependent oxidoreductase n=1 Tax=Bradyrhizobium sp. CCGUVB1N3 TaxID=2949629 RepID=UPI0020B24434|nr:FAD-binding oxidoreductase [Bradyrhizobium sp. CCGUVB1N3]MCP3468996.1 FAD-binding oxidoreductase [Bradyrhizobium sp. CCGUVB1N3]
MNQDRTALRIAVIGAGIVGAATAWELIKDGHEVTLIEPGEPGGRQSASYGNGSWISPASIIPMSMPGLWRKVPAYLFDPNGPLVLRWTALPVLVPWLLRFLAAGWTVAKVERTARALASILRDGPARHAALAKEIGKPDCIRRTGLLYAYPDRKAFEDESLAWRLRKDNGLRWVELDAGELRRGEPDLSSDYQFGAFVPEGAHCIDPGAYVSDIVDAARVRGAVIVKANATGFVMAGDRLAAVVTDHGRVECDRAVICAGIWSKVLAEAAGNRVPLASERGYHGVIASPAAGPRLPIMPSDGRMANTPTPAGLRLSGQVELAQVEAEPDWARVEILVGHALRTYPGLGSRAELTIDRWMGHRPSTPDGRPVIGKASASEDIFHAFGHGHIGLASGPITGRIVADLIVGRDAGIDLAPFSATRFHN